MSNLTQDEKNALITAMKAEGIESGTVLAVLDRLEATFPARPVSVTQSAQVVEKGATVIGYQADRIG